MATRKMENAITEYSFSSGEMCWSIWANEAWFLCASKCHLSFVYSLWRWFSVPVVCRRFPLKNDLLVDFICVMVVDSLLKSITDIRIGNFSHSVCYCWAVRQLAELNPFSLSHSLCIHLKLVHHELKWMAFDHILCDDKLPIIWITNISNFPRALQLLFTHIHPPTHHIFLSFVYFIVSISLFSFTSTVRCASYPLHHSNNRTIFSNESCYIFHFYLCYGFLSVFSVIRMTEIFVLGIEASWRQTCCHFGHFKGCGLTLYSKQQTYRMI